MNESVSERVELVNVFGDLATFVRNIFRDEVVGAEGHTYGNDAVRDENTISVEEFAEVRERGVIRGELDEVCVVEQQGMSRGVGAPKKRKKGRDGGV